MSKSVGRRVPMPKHRWHKLPISRPWNGVMECLCLECGLLKRTVPSHGTGSLYPEVRYFRNGTKIGNRPLDCPGERLRFHA